MLTKATDLRNALLEDSNVIAFVGSGLSTNFMNWVDFLVSLCKYADYEEGLNMLQSASSWSLDLDTLLLIAGEAKKRFTPSELRDFMESIFKHDNPIPSVFKALIYCPFRFYVTTNYDCNLEDCYLSVHGVPLSVILPSHAHEMYRHIQQGTPFLFKIHGCARRGSDLVISHDDYQKTIYANRELRYVLSAIFAMYQVVFLGYGHRDPHVCRYLEYERTVVTKGSMRRYSFVRADDFSPAFRARLNSLGVSYVTVSSFAEVETFFNQLVFSRVAEKSDLTKTQYRKDYLSFLREPKKETVWGALLYAYTGSEISNGDETKRINSVIDANKVVRDYIEQTSPINLIFRILQAQAHKRANESNQARREFEQVIEIARMQTDLLPLLRAVALRYAGMFWLFPSGQDPKQIQDLALASALFDEALAFLGSESLRERLDIQKWKAIVAGELGQREEAVTQLLALAEENERKAYKKAAAWCYYAAANQMLQGGLINQSSSRQILDILEKVYWGFAELNHLFGIGSVLFLKAKALYAIYGPSSEVHDYLEQARARAIVARDLRLLSQCDSFRRSIVQLIPIGTGE